MENEDKKVELSDEDKALLATAKGGKIVYKGKEFAVADVVSSMEYLTGARAQLLAEVQQLKDAAGKAPTKDVPGKVDDQDLESMSRAEHDAYLMAKMKKEVMGPLEGKLSEAVSDQNKLNMAAEVARLEVDNPDLRQYEPEIRAVMGKYPGLSIDDAYVLARHEAPDKVKSLAAKAGEKDAAEAAAAKEEDEGQFSGLFPTSTLTQRKPMKQDEAVADAWKATMGNHGKFLDMGT